MKTIIYVKARITFAALQKRCRVFVLAIFACVIDRREKYWENGKMRKVKYRLDTIPLRNARQNDASTEKGDWEHSNVALLRIDERFLVESKDA